jgi:hypothetical protein
MENPATHHLAGVIAAITQKVLWNDGQRAIHQGAAKADPEA